MAKKQKTTKVATATTTGTTTTSATTPRTRRKGPARQRATAAPAEQEPVAELETADPLPPEPAPEPTGDFGPDTATLGDLARTYVHHLEKQGKAPGTTRSYLGELKLACSVLGAETRLADLTPDSIRAFNAHPRVTHTRDGEQKAMVGVRKSQRVLRLALLWATAEGYVDAAVMAAVQE